MHEDRRHWLVYEMQMQIDSTLSFYLAQWHSSKMPTVLVLMHFGAIAKSWRWHFREGDSILHIWLRQVHEDASTSESHESQQNKTVTSQQNTHISNMIHPSDLWRLKKGPVDFQDRVKTHTECNSWLMDSLWHGQCGGPAPIMRSLITVLCDAAFFTIQYDLPVTFPTLYPHWPFSTFGMGWV